MSKRIVNEAENWCCEDGSTNPISDGTLPPFCLLSSQNLENLLLTNFKFPLCVKGDARPTISNKIHLFLKILECVIVKTCYIQSAVYYSATISGMCGHVKT